MKVLLVYPNLMLVSLLPTNIALLIASLRQAGHTVRLFDTTLYRTVEKTNDERRVERMQVRRFDIKDAGVVIKDEDVYEDFARVVAEYKPGLIGVSVVDDTVKMSLELIGRANRGSIPTIFGGVHAILNAENLIKEKEVDMLCVGEGEQAIVDLCDCLENGRSYNSVENLWIKRGNQIVKNKLSTPVELETLPIEDFSLFENQRIYRPMQGKMLATIPINLDRGCPYRCTFCDAPAIADRYKGYYRTKSVNRIRDEIKYQIKRFSVSYFYFNSETFMAMSLTKLQEFAKMYSEFGLPFWCQTRIEMITDNKVRLLKEMNCDRISVGIEHGNEQFRMNFLNKRFTNAQVINAFEILNKYDIKINVNNMLGFPDETRELVFDTIELNRQIKSDAVNGFAFQPYYGTWLREYSINRGYLAQDSREIDDPNGMPVLDMPQFTREEIIGLLRTFVLYVKLPEEYFPRIKQAEQLTEVGNQVLDELREFYFREYFG